MLCFWGREPRLAWAGLSLMVLSFLGGLAAVAMGIVAFGFLTLLLSDLWQSDCLPTWGEIIPVLSYLTLTGLLGGGASLCYRAADAGMEKFDAKDVVPFTRATVANLPVPESLVRASEEPVQAQETLLLRAAAEGQETPPEQLLRAAEGH